MSEEPLNEDRHGLFRSPDGGSYVRVFLAWKPDFHDTR